MEIIKEVKALHRKYVREEEPNSIVLNLKNWPDVDWCYIHRDKKGWGTYIRNGKFYNIGRGHQITLSPMIGSSPTLSPYLYLLTRSFTHLRVSFFAQII